jgi:alcohol dehydrogenase class IV
MVNAIAKINIPPTVIVGSGASQELSKQVKRLGARRVLLITDQFLMASGLAEPVIKHLQSNGISVAVYSDVQPDPTVVNVLEGLRMFGESSAELIIALGGGSPIDAAKAIAILTTNPPPLSQYMGYHRIPKPGVPLIAIPTTAGTGSEVTKVTVITDTAENVKMMMLDANLLPTVALIDYEFTLSMPSSLTAYVGIDTLTHAIEAYVSSKSNAMIDPIALSCVRLVAENLFTAWSTPNDRPAREAMSLAAAQGGMAFSNSSVCLVHGMSRPLGAIYHVPHGLSNATLLPTVTRFSIPGALPRYATVARMMQLATSADDDETAAEALVVGLEDLNVHLQIPRLRDCVGVNSAKFELSVEKMASDALASGSPQNNPIVPSAQQICDLYRAAW